jgi:hypothetical protein
MDMFMRLQYLSDYTGKHTAVVIPITEWEAIISKHSDLKSLEQDFPKDVPVKKYTMGDFKGILSPESADELLKHVEQSRNELVRCFSW